MENLNDYINEKTIIKDEQYNEIKDSIICQICKDIIIIPIMCSECKNSFCKKCIEKWDINNKKCPFRCEKPNYIKNDSLEEEISNLKFECINCQNKINYKDLIQHFYSKCGKEEVNKDLLDIENPSSFREIFEKKAGKILPQTQMTINCKLIKIFIFFFIFSNFFRP